jgi:hypothetical protein
MQNSIREFFFHGREKYDTMSELYKGVYLGVYHTEIIFPSYDDILEAFMSYSVKEPQGSEEYSNSKGEIATLFYVITGVSLVATIYMLVHSICEKVHVDASLEYRVSPVQGSQVMTRKKLRKYLGEQVREQCIAQAILDYVGKCKVQGCEWFCQNNGLCLNHNQILTIPQRLRLSMKNLYHCFACSKEYFRSPSSMIMYLCPQCCANYCCWLCEWDDPCVNHKGIEKVLTMSGYLERGIIDDTAEEDKVYDSNKNYIFVNYHRALGIRI